MSDDLSVVVCTRDRGERVGPTLDALLGQPVPFPVVVVDQSEHPDAALAARAAAEPRLEVVRDEGRGLSRARNLGWRRTATTWVAFVDDDCIVAPDWAPALQRAFREHPDVWLVSGNVDGNVPDEDSVPVATFPVTEERVRSGPRTRAWDVGFGVCMALRREAIERLGGWDERLGAGVPEFPAAEDEDFNYRLLRAGGSALATPSVRALHDQWRGRDEVGPLLRGYMAGHSGMAIKHLRTGDVRGGLWLWLLGVEELARTFLIGVRRASPHRVAIAWFKLQGLVLGTARALRRRW